MKIKRKILLITLLFITVFITAFLVGGDNYKVEVDIDNEEILSVKFEYEEDTLFKKGRNIIHIETKEQTYVIDTDFHSNVEFVKSDTSTLIKKNKVNEFILGAKLVKSYITVNLDSELINEVSDLYVKERKETLNVLDESELKL